MSVPAPRFMETGHHDVMAHECRHLDLDERGRARVDLPAHGFRWLRAAPVEGQRRLPRSCAPHAAAALGPVPRRVV